MERKGQAAMEFLMTYGWAILAAIIAIAVLAYFGVFSPGRYVGSACVVSSPFSCEEFKISAASGIQIALRNGYGGTVDNVVVSVTGCTTSSTAVNDVADGTIVGATYVTVTGCGLTADETFKGDVTVSFVKEGGTIAQTASGSLRGKVVA